VVEKDLQSAILDYFKNFNWSEGHDQRDVYIRGWGQDGYPVGLDRHSQERRQKSDNP